MTVGEMIEYLSDFDEDTEVRLMTQEGYPFENSISGVVDGETLCTDAIEKFAGKVYIVEGKQLGYGTKRAWMC